MALIPAVAFSSRRWMVAGAGVLLAAGLLAGRAMRAEERIDRCALPAGFSIDALGPEARVFATRRAMACADLEHGRTDRAAYREAIGALDERLDAVPVVPPTPPAMVWGASVRAMSTQYAIDNWSAAQALGAPDVWPANGDQVKAWASTGADDRVEFLEVGLARPVALSAVEVYETFNPGAVSEIELIAASGKRIVVHRAAAAAAGEAAVRKRVDFACTAEPIVAVRVTIDSPRVAGWNEIDAIGGQPCAER
jgi:hypothetical protein